MLCPDCGKEYRDGSDKCADCGTSLIDSPSSEAPSNEPADPQASLGLETVLSSGDGGLITLAESILDEHGIEYAQRNDSLQDLFAGGRLGAGFNPVVGPVELRVPAENAEAARQALAELLRSQHERAAGQKDSAAGVDDEEPPEADGEAAVAQNEQEPSQRAKKVFQLLVLVEFLSYGIGSFLYDEMVLRIPDRLWEMLDEALPPGFLTFASSELYTVTFFAWALASLGMLLFLRPARLFYAALWVWILALAAWSTASIDYGWSGFWSLLGHLLGGAIIALSFYGPISVAFKKGISSDDS
ncbi:MAG: DUF2007 domain-containing protein [Acidobacteriota bacterium]|nr:DUF2007 domain-containing protein [Acidobacteriota bacterium]